MLVRLSEGLERDRARMDFAAMVTATATISHGTADVSDRTKPPPLVLGSEAACGDGPSSSSLNSRSFCLHLLNSDITGLHHHAQQFHPCQKQFLSKVSTELSWKVLLKERSIHPKHCQSRQTE